MESTRFFRALAALCILGFFLTGCVMEELFNPVGKDIKFSAQTTTSRISTKTVYTGETVSGGDNHTGKIEIIGWENNDLITVISAQAASPNTSDYSLTPASSYEGKYHYAEAAPTSSDGHGLQWGEGEHIFYAMYPAAASAGAQSGIGITTNSNGYGVVSLSLPENQSYTLTRPSKSESGDDQVYYGDMRLAYMTAATKGTPTGDPILLSFMPVVTTFYVTVKNTTGSAMTLKRVALSSETDALCGSFTVTLLNVNTSTGSYNNEPDFPNYTCNFAYPSRSSSNSTIYSDFGTAGLSMAADESVVVALFALPRYRTEYISGLTLSVTSDETGEVSLPLKQNGDWIQFTGCNKHNINNVEVPDVEYVLHARKYSEPDDPTYPDFSLTYDYTGVHKSASVHKFVVTSKKIFNPRTSAEYERPADWKTQIYDDATNGWVDLEGNCPTWLNNFPLDQTGRTAADGTIARTDSLQHFFNESVAVQPVTSHVDKLKSNKIYDASGNEYDNSQRAHAVDLSRYNFITRTYNSNEPRTTANCYIIASPGWYKFPMVYGNLYENGYVVHNACKGNGLHLNHLDMFKKAPANEDIWLGRNYPWLRTGTGGVFIESHRHHTRIYWELYQDSPGGTNSTYVHGAKYSSQDYTPTGGLTVEGTPTEPVTGGDEVYMYFYVDPAKIKPGNFLLASFNEDDDCCWSWHIWVTDQNMKLVDYGGNSILPVNLGWIDTSEGQYYEARSARLKFVSTEKEGLEWDEMTVEQPYFERASTTGWQTYYQWGRKDPLTDKSTYGITGIKKDDRALNGSIKHPTQIQYDEATSAMSDQSEYYDWTSANYNNLWDSQNTDYGTPVASLPNHKTVYDPSPRGFSVAPDKAWTGLDTYYSFKENEDNSLYGVMFYTSSAKTDSLFFPAVGCLAFESGALSDNGKGFYWTIHPGENGNRRASYSLRFDKSGSTLNYHPELYGPIGSFAAASRAYCFGVRPVLYTVAASGSDALTGTTTREITFSSLLGSSNIDDLDGHSYYDGEVTVSFSRPNGVSGNKPKYDASTGAVQLTNSTGSLINPDNWTTTMTVSVPSDKNIVQIYLYFASNDTGPNPEISTVSSPNDGGGFEDGNGSQEKNGVWSISNYSNGTFDPDANAVTFKTSIISGDRYLTGLSVIYK